MKQVIYLFVLSLLFFSCQNDDEFTLTDTGWVVDYAGSGGCGIVIELDNGSRIIPVYYPRGFIFSQGQRILVEYTELPHVIPDCERGTASDIKYVEELSCSPYVDLYLHNYDSLARDPVYIHEVFTDGSCVQIKLSYSGGCKEHTIELARMHPWAATGSSVPVFEIRHNANNDMCEAYFTREFRFDLSSLKQEGKKEFILIAKLADGKMYNQVFELEP